MPDLLLALVLGIPLAVLVVANTAGIWLLRKHGAFARFLPVEDLDAIVPAHDPRGLEVLARAFRHPDFRHLLTQVMNSVGKCEPGPSRYPLAVLRHIQRGGGLTCAGMANLYFNVLRLNGIPARQVYLSRCCFDSLDTHVTVEVLVDGVWIVADPTFHVSFRRDGELIGARTIAQLLWNDSGSAIHPEWYGPTRYPHHLESYYLPWARLFSNVFVADRDQPGVGLWARLPPFRYWWGPVMYFQREPKISYSHLEFQDALYFLFVVVLPVTLLGLAGALVLWLFA